MTDAEQRRAFNLMHQGEFLPALRIFAQQGAIHWKGDQAEARATLVEKWARDSAAAPEKSRFVLAYTNADVAQLNADLRAVRRARGELGPDHELPTAEGKQMFAAGDRVQFTGSALRRQDREAGLANGNIGTVRSIEKNRMTVALEDRPGAPQRMVSFIVGADRAAGQFDQLRHGYAGTVYKSQGRTLDQTYLYHSEHWRSASSYVALTRHRADVALFAATETARDLGQLARQMARVDDCRAASQFYAASAAGAGEGRAGPQHFRRGPAGMSDTSLSEGDEIARRQRDAQPAAPVHPPTEELARRQAEQQVEACRAAEQAERRQQQETSARQLREQGDKEAEEARKAQNQREEEQLDRRAAGDITDARGRYAEALAGNYSARDPWGTLANAAMSEYGMFNRQQQELRAEAAKEKDPERARLIELRREIEAHEYMAITSDRLAGISRAITRGDNPSAQKDQEAAKAYRERADELRQERTDLQREMRQRGTDEQGGHAGQEAATVQGSPNHNESAGERAARQQPETDGRAGVTPHAPSRSSLRTASTAPQRAEDGPEPREEIRSHAGQQGAQVQGNAAHTETAREREERQARQQEQDTKDRAGLKPSEPAEGRPTTKEEREARTEDPWAALAAKGGYTGPPPARDTGRTAERPTGRGGRGGRG